MGRRASSLVLLVAVLALQESPAAARVCSGYTLLGSSASDGWSTSIVENVNGFTRKGYSVPFSSSSPSVSGGYNLNVYDIGAGRWEYSGASMPTFCQSTVYNSFGASMGHTAADSSANAFCMLSLRYDVTAGSTMRCFSVVLGDMTGDPSCGASPGDGHTYYMYVDGGLISSGTIAGTSQTFGDYNSGTALTTLELAVGANNNMDCDTFSLTMDVYGSECGGCAGGQALGSRPRRQWRSAALRDSAQLVACAAPRRGRQTFSQPVAGVSTMLAVAFARVSGAASQPTTASPRPTAVTPALPPCSASPLRFAYPTPLSARASCSSAAVCDAHPRDRNVHRQQQRAQLSIVDSDSHVLGIPAALSLGHALPHRQQLSCADAQQQRHGQHQRHGCHDARALPQRQRHSESQRQRQRDCERHLGCRALRKQHAGRFSLRLALRYSLLHSSAHG